MNLNYTDKKRNLSLLPKVEQIDGAGGGGGPSPPPPPHGGFVVVALWHKINEVQGRRGGRLEDCWSTKFNIPAGRSPGQR